MLAICLAKLIPNSTPGLDVCPCGCVGMQAAKRQALGRGEKVEMVETDWRWWPAKFVEQNPYKVGRRAAVGRQRQRWDARRFIKKMCQEV